MQKVFEVRCFGTADDYRFKFKVSVPFKPEKSTLKQRKNEKVLISRIIRESRRQIRTVKKEFMRKSYGCSFGKIKSIMFNDTVVNL